MSKLLIAAFVLALFAACGGAQETPVADVAGGYSFIKEVNSFGLTANGGSGSFAYNINNWLGAASDFALYHSAPVGPGVDAGTYTFGPRFSYRHWGRFTPFTQVLLGGVRFSNNGFVFGAGGGADISLDPGGRFALRQQVEYFGFRANGVTTNTVRVSTSLVFRFRKRP